MALCAILSGWACVLAAPMLLTRVTILALLLAVSCDNAPLDPAPRATQTSGRFRILRTLRGGCRGRDAGRHDGDEDEEENMRIGVDLLDRSAAVTEALAKARKGGDKALGRLAESFVASLPAEEQDAYRLTMKAVLKKAKGRSKAALKEVEAEKDGTDQGTDASASKRGGTAEAEATEASQRRKHAEEDDALQLWASVSHAPPSSSPSMSGGEAVCAREPGELRRALLRASAAREDGTGTEEEGDDASSGDGEGEGSGDAMGDDERASPRVLVCSGEHLLEARGHACELGARRVECWGGAAPEAATTTGRLVLGRGGGEVCQVAFRVRPSEEHDGTILVRGGGWELRECDVVSDGGTALLVDAHPASSCVGLRGCKVGGRQAAGVWAARGVMVLAGHCRMLRCDVEDVGGRGGASGVAAAPSLPGGASEEGAEEDAASFPSDHAACSALFTGSLTMMECLVERVGLLLMAGHTASVLLLNSVAHLPPLAPAIWIWKRSSVDLRLLGNRIVCSSLFAADETLALLPRRFEDRDNLIEPPESLSSHASQALQDGDA